MSIRMRLEVWRYHAIKRLDAFDWWPSGCEDKRSCHEHRSVYLIRRWPFVVIGLLCIPLIELGWRPCPVCKRVFPPFHPNCRCHILYAGDDLSKVPPTADVIYFRQTEINLRGTFDKS